MITDDDDEIYRKPDGLRRRFAPKNPCKSALKLAGVEVADMSEELFSGSI